MRGGLGHGSDQRGGRGRGTLGGCGGGQVELLEPEVVMDTIQEFRNCGSVNLQGDPSA